ncbi:hypothetical protein [Comamonas sp.]|uniref:hypothetical protein n=1 Tax=Comamonas sp. TaxID=34028 RepID=UPI00289D5160|nr:hypothetical protein [Comamonas sp.]
MVGTPAIFFIDPAKLPKFSKWRIPISRGKVKKNQPKTKTYIKRALGTDLFRFDIDNYSHSMLRCAHRRCQGVGACRHAPGPRNGDGFIVGRLLGPVQPQGRFGQPTIFSHSHAFFPMKPAQSMAAAHRRRCDGIC